MIVLSHAAEGWLAAARAKHAAAASMRDVELLYAAVVEAGALPEPEEATFSSELAAAWTAVDGFSDTSFISFADEAYAAMRDDDSRTPVFAEAIQSRLAESPPQTLSVLDIGCGPFALLALLAARAGARKVWAIEVNPKAAARAREAVAAAGFSGVVEVVEGFSTSAELPAELLEEKVDLVVSEIIGSIASEEGVYATIRDAHLRLVKEPTDPASWIPCRCQTWGAPASYALHHALGAPHYDWGGLSEPLRLNCLDASLQARSQSPRATAPPPPSPPPPSPPRSLSAAYHPLPPCCS